MLYSFEQKGLDFFRFYTFKVGRFLEFSLDALGSKACLYVYLYEWTVPMY
jgi:hypothetical protein